MKKLFILLWLLLPLAVCFASEPNDYHQWNCIGNCTNTPHRRIPVFNVFTVSGCQKVRNEHKNEPLIICKNPLIDDATIFYGDRAIMPNELNQVSKEIYEKSDEFKQEQVVYMQEEKKRQVFVPVYWSAVLLLFISAVYSGVTCWRNKNRVYKNWPDAIVSMVLVLPVFIGIFMLGSLPEEPSAQTRLIASVSIVSFLLAVLAYHVWRVKGINPGRNSLVLALIVSGRLVYSVLIPFFVLAALSEGKRERAQSYAGSVVELAVRGAILYGLWVFTKKLMARE